MKHCLPSQTNVDKNNEDTTQPAHSQVHAVGSLAIVVVVMTILHIGSEWVMSPGFLPTKGKV